MHIFTFPKLVTTSAISALLTLVIPHNAEAKNNESANSMSCKGLLTAVMNTPANSVARNKILEKLYTRNCGEDPDNDGLFSFEETLFYNTDPNNSDTDGDGLKDGEEVKTHLTDPLVADTDGDGLKDGEEVLTYRTSPLAADTDVDGLKDGEEVWTYLTDPLVADTDADGLRDGEEVLTYRTNPVVADTDADGLKDGEEVLTYLSDPLNADTDADGLKDGEEVLTYLTNPVVADSDADGLKDGEEVWTYNTNPVIADTDVDGLNDGEEVYTYNTNPLNPDSDTDTLTDGDEVLTYLTDPLNNDTDADKLPDGWEVNGHPNGTLLIDANPRRADLYVEMDYMVRESATNGLGPNANVIAGIIEVFNNAPVPNPDGSTGITIHLELDQEIPYDADLDPYQTEILAIKAAYFESRKSPVYHYMIWANGYAGGSSSGVSLGIPASDFIVTLGFWEGGNGGSDEQKIGTFIHELGHNLGLKHGGSDHSNYKPNYISVMNYLFQTTGIPTPTGVQFDYQRFDLPPLDENNLSDQQGLYAGPEWDGYSTRYHCTNTYTRKETLTKPIDWNCDNLVDDTVSGDVNRNGSVSILTSQNNWENIDFGGDGVIGLGVSRRLIRRVIEPQLETELTWEQHQDLTETKN